MRMRLPAAAFRATAIQVLPALAQQAEPITVHGKGFASKQGTGRFTAQLPDGTNCSAAFWGGAISLFGKSATKAKATCTNGASSYVVTAVVSRRLNGLPKEATLYFNDGSRVIVVIPRDAATRPPPPTTR